MTLFDADVSQCDSLTPSTCSIAKIAAIPQSHIYIGHIAQIVDADSQSARASNPLSLHRITQQQKDSFMRFYEDDHAYEIEPVRDPATQLCTGWRYNVYRIRPDHKLLRSGEASTREEAEVAGRKALASVVGANAKADSNRGHAA